MKNMSKANDREPRVPADTQRYPRGCRDPEWCRFNRFCCWDCLAESYLHDTIEEKRDHVDRIDRLIGD
jgi:hypothetical protein